MEKIQLADSYRGFLLHTGLCIKELKSQRGMTPGSFVLITTLTPQYRQSQQSTEGVNNQRVRRDAISNRHHGLKFPRSLLLESRDK